MTRGDRTRSVAAVDEPRLVSPGGRRLPLQFAFTLVELLVVIGIVALIAGGFGLALGDSGGPALATAQTSVLTMAGAARAQAAVQQTKVRLYVYGTRPPVGDAEKFLRLLQLFREEPADSGNYLPVGSAVVLPRGVYVVPNSTTGLVARISPRALRLAAERPDTISSSTRTERRSRRTRSSPSRLPRSRTISRSSTSRPQCAACSCAPAVRLWR
jgi:prepilin-type N-terminal cleavage/methylation domain-containing protein